MIVEAETLIILFIFVILDQRCEIDAIFLYFFRLILNWRNLCDKCNENIKGIFSVVGPAAVASLQYTMIKWDETFDNPFQNEMITY